MTKPIAEIWWDNSNDCDISLDLIMQIVRRTEALHED